MSLEARIEQLTAAVVELTKVIGSAHAEAKPSSTPAKDEAPNAPPKSQDAPSTSESSSEKSPVLDYAKDVKPITIRVSKEKGRETAVSVLQRFGVKGAQELSPDQWPDYVAHCESVLAGGGV